MIVVKFHTKHLLEILLTRRQSLPMGFRLVPLRLSECKTTLGRGETGSGDLEQGGPGSAASSSSLGPTRPAEVSAGEHGWALGHLWGGTSGMLSGAARPNLGPFSLELFFSNPSALIKELVSPGLKGSKFSFLLDCTGGEGNGTPLQYSCLENPMDGGAWWAAVHGVAKSRTQLSDFTFTFHFHTLEKEMATHSSVVAWRIPGTGEPGGLPSLGSHRVRHD